MPSRSVQISIDAVALVSLSFLTGCPGRARPPSRLPDGAPISTAPSHLPDVTPITTAPTCTGPGALPDLQSALAANATLDADTLLACRAIHFDTALGYEPAHAIGFDRIQAGYLALRDGALARFARDGFAIEPQWFPNFTSAYALAYAEHLPVYITADSVLHAMHSSFEPILRSAESFVFRGQLNSILGAMRDALAAGAGSSLGPDARADADLYLTVAASLSNGSVLRPVAGADPAAIEAIVAQVLAHNGMGTIDLYGAGELVDFSQFTPRGHYTEPPLDAYFRASMWLGREGFVVERPSGQGTLSLDRRRLRAALAMREAMSGDARAAWAGLDRALTGVIGPPDAGTVVQLDALMATLHLASAHDLDGLDEATIVDALASTGGGVSQIASRLLIDGVYGTTHPSPRSFVLVPQRYVVDSHVFGNVVFDRAGRGSILRMRPNPLDVAYAALGNDQAASLLAPDLHAFPYAPDLENMRTLVDAHDDAYWSQSIYGQWLQGLRELSPRVALAGHAGTSLPTVARTEAWGRRLLQTQLASWAELRHDTLLYTAQSYTSGVTCEYPDAYVDPYPALFQALSAQAGRARSLFHALDWGTARAVGDHVTAHYDHFAAVADLLGAIAERERQGLPLTAEQLAFVNDAVALRVGGCGGAVVGTVGWYPALFFADESLPRLPPSLPAIEVRPTIADVHTQPTDASGAPVGHVLHVATGFPHMMIVAVDTCDGPRAYAGPVSSYYEVTTDNFERLDDSRWSLALRSNPATVPWLAELTAR